jgi:hypothetical protein
MKLIQKPMLRSLLAVVILLCISITGLRAQELKCQLTVNAQKITGVDPSVFTNMQTTLNEIMNTKAWTSDIFSPEERIECSIFIQITGSPAQDVYTGTMTVQSSRPVFNSTYSSPMFNFLDKDFEITFVQNQAVDFSPTTFNSNLASILQFYAYMIIGLDYESFSKAGGTKYFNLAEQTMTAVPTSGADSKGWKPNDGTRNRYWLIRNIQGSKYEPFRKALWDYHFAGMDNFYDKPALARANILNALDKLEQISKEDPNCILLAVFFQAKSDELVGVFSGATDPSEKTKAVNYLKALDPTNSTKYDKLMKN